MSHFAKVIDGVVVEVIVASQDVIDSGLFGESNLWVQTSYNTRGGVHYAPDGLPDNGIALRKNYAGIGFSYDIERDAFIPPKPFESWVLNVESCLWNPPKPKPDGAYYWDEGFVDWVAVT